MQDNLLTAIIWTVVLLGAPMAGLYASWRHVCKQEEGKDRFPSFLSVVGFPFSFVAHICRTQDWPALGLMFFGLLVAIFMGWLVMLPHIFKALGQS